MQSGAAGPWELSASRSPPGRERDSNGIFVAAGKLVTPSRGPGTNGGGSGTARARARRARRARRIIGLWHCIDAVPGLARIMDSWVPGGPAGPLSRPA